jgi:hypothetical protein
MTCERLIDIAWIAGFGLASAAGVTLSCIVILLTGGVI